MNRTLEALRLQAPVLTLGAEERPAPKAPTLTLTAAPLQPFTKVFEIPIDYLRDPKLHNAHVVLQELFKDPLYEPTPGLSFQIVFRLRDTWNHDPDPRNVNGSAIEVIAHGPNEDLQSPGILPLTVLKYVDMIATHRGAKYRGEKGWSELSTFGVEVLQDLNAIRVELEMSPRDKPA